MIGDSFLHSRGLNSIDANYTGIVTTQSLRVIGDLEVEGTTTTLDTALTEVDKLEVGANNNTVGVAITQSGTGDILNLYDDSTQVVTVKDGGRVGIGTDGPLAKLEVYTDSNDVGGIVQVIQDGTGDASIDFQLKGTREYTLGIDNSDGDKFKLSGSAGLGSNDLITVTSTGSVGIGTVNPLKPLQVHDDTTSAVLITGPSPQIRLNSNSTDGSDNDRAMFGLATGNGHFVGGAVAGDAILRTTNGGNLLFGEGTTETLRITSAGNMGLGVTPETWSSNVKGFQIGRQACVSGQTGANIVEISANAYHNSGWKYIETDTATKYYQYQGSHRFETAGSGTADASISFTERLRITSDGKVGIGTDDPGNHKLHLYGETNSDLRLTATGNDIVNIFTNSNRSSANTPIFALKGEWNGNQVANMKFVAGDDTTNKDDGYITFNTRKSGDGASTERLRITSDGELELRKNQDGVTGRPDNRIIFKDTDTSVAANQPIGEISWYSTDAGMVNVNSYIRGINEATNGSGALTFGVKASGSSEIEALRITSGGLLGVGLTNPNSNLHVRGGSESTDNLLLTLQSAGVANDGSLSTGLRLINSTSNTSIHGADIRAIRTGGSSADLTFSLYYGGGSPAERLRITAAGNVGIGTDSMSSALQIYACLLYTSPSPRDRG